MFGRPALIGPLAPGSYISQMNGAPQRKVGRDGSRWRVYFSHLLPCIEYYRREQEAIVAVSWLRNGKSMAGAFGGRGPLTI